MKKIAILLTILLFELSLNAITPKRQTAKEEKDPLRGARISLLVKDLNTGRIVMEKNPEMCVTPASVTKIITTATALEILGADFRFETKLSHDGYIDEKGVLHGNLYIIGDGDPTLGSSYLGDINFVSNWCRKLKTFGIKHITGNIIADAGCYDHCPVPISWSWEDMGSHYAQGVYGLSAYDNSCNITLESRNPGSTPRIIGVYPNIPDMVIENRVKALNARRDSVYAFGMPYDKKRIIDGGIPANRSRYLVRCDIGNPPLLVAENLRSALSAYGIGCDGKAKYTMYNTKDSLTLIFSYSSPKLSDIIHHTNFKSDNMYAEHIFKHLGLTVAKSGASNSLAYSVTKRFWERRGVNFSSVRIDDGSGLSPQNAYSASFLVDILCEMEKSPNADIFIRSLPIAGKEGTVSGFLHKTPLEGKVHVKSGSMSNVQCYSGYILLDNGKRYAFAALVNYYGCSRAAARKEIKKWLLEAARI